MVYELGGAWLSVADKHDLMVGCNIVWDQDVLESTVAFVWTEGLFKLSSVCGTILFTFLSSTFVFLLFFLLFLCS